jgi:hypothetical protein
MTGLRITAFDRESRAYLRVMLNVDADDQVESATQGDSFTPNVVGNTHPGQWRARHSLADYRLLLW